MKNQIQNDLAGRMKWMFLLTFQFLSFAAFAQSNSESPDRKLCQQVLAVKPALSQEKGQECYESAKILVKQKNPFFLEGSFELYGALVQDELSKKIRTNETCFKFFDQLNRTIGLQGHSEVELAYPAKAPYTPTVPRNGVKHKWVVTDLRDPVVRKESPIRDHRESLDRIYMTFNTCIQEANSKSASRTATASTDFNSTK